MMIYNLFRMGHYLATYSSYDGAIGGAHETALKRGEITTDDEFAWRPVQPSRKPCWDSWVGTYYGGYAVTEDQLH